jgi:hypothetical protein
MLIAERFLSCVVMLDTMEIILFPPMMAVHGILKPVSFSKWIIFILLFGEKPY